MDRRRLTVLAGKAVPVLLSILVSCLIMLQVPPLFVPGAAALQRLNCQSCKIPPWMAMPLRVVQSPSVAGWWFWAPPIQASLQGG